jgi:hypothetical protein
MLYDDQEFNFAGPYGESGFLEDCDAQVRGETIGNVVLVTGNTAGQAQHINVNGGGTVSITFQSRGYPRARGSAQPTSPHLPRYALTGAGYQPAISGLDPEERLSSTVIPFACPNPCRKNPASMKLW